MAEHEYLTVPELAELLRIKERKVYDLASEGEVPCTRATGKLLFPVAGVRAWLDKHSEGMVAPPPRPANPRAALPGRGDLGRGGRRARRMVNLPPGPATSHPRPNQTEETP